MSSISSVYTSATQGLQTATASLERSAVNVANLSVAQDRVSISPEARAGGPDLIQETVTQMNASTAFKANLKTLRTAQELDLALFDMIRR